MAGYDLVQYIPGRVEVGRIEWDAIERRLERYQRIEEAARPFLTYPPPTTAGDRFAWIKLRDELEAAFGPLSEGEE